MGEVLVRGPQVFAGYRNGARAEESAFLFDWFRTGDIGMLEVDTGYLRLVGRSRDVIITGGLNVYPKEVEEALRQIAGVEDAAVVAMPSDRWGQEVVAFVTPSGLSPELIEAAVRRLLAPYKCPKRLVAVDRIPRNELGKVQRDRLVERI
jgi:malonyl-CoA/methylmalonyl-CoA synthetase